MIKAYFFNDLDGAFQVENPAFIPRIGEKVNFGYSPACTVEDVVYDFSSNAIYVKCH